MLIRKTQKSWMRKRNSIIIYAIGHHLHQIAVICIVESMKIRFFF